MVNVFMNNQYTCIDIVLVNVRNGYDRLHAFLGSRMYICTRFLFQVVRCAIYIYSLSFPGSQMCQICQEGVIVTGNMLAE